MRAVCGISSAAVKNARDDTERCSTMPHNNNKRTMRRSFERIRLSTSSVLFLLCRRWPCGILVRYGNNCQKFSLGPYFVLCSPLASSPKCECYKMITFKSLVTLETPSRTYWKSGSMSQRSEKSNKKTLEWINNTAEDVMQNYFNVEMFSEIEK